MEVTKYFTQDFFLHLLALKKYVYVTSQLQADSMVRLSPTISFKLQIDQFGQEFAKRTLVRNPIISIRTRVRFGQES